MHFLRGRSQIHIYEWCNVPRADGYSPSQLMFGRNQRTCLLSLPSQNPPIDFKLCQPKILHIFVQRRIMIDRSIVYLSFCQVSMSIFKMLNLLPAIVLASLSMRPNKLSYVINVNNQFFTRPRRLLRPVVTPSPSDPPSALPLTQVSSSALRRSERLQSRVISSAVQISTSRSSLLSPCPCSNPPKSFSTASTAKSSLVLKAKGEGYLPLASGAVRTWLFRERLSALARKSLK